MPMASLQMKFRYDGARRVSPVSHVTQELCGSRVV